MASTSTLFNVPFAPVVNDRCGPSCDGYPDFVEMCRKERNEFVESSLKQFSPDFTTAQGRTQVKNFFDKHDVRVNFHPEDPQVWKFKYKTSVRFDKHWKLATRGDVVRVCNQTYKTETYMGAFLKFFTDFQFPKMFGFSSQELNWDAPAGYKVTSKEDGSYIQVFPCPVKTGEVMVNTSGSFGEDSHDPNSKQLGKSARLTLCEDIVKHVLNRELVLHLELCYQYNKVVTTYAQECVYLLDVTTLSGHPVNSEVKNAVVDTWLSHPSGTRKVVSCTPLSSQEEFDDYLQTYAQEQEKKGVQDPEGVVLYYDSYPVMKTKLPEYLEKHKLAGSLNLNEQKRTLDKAFLEGKADDVNTSSFQEEYLTKVEAWFHRTVDLLKKANSELPNLENVTKRDYAQAAKPFLTHPLLKNVPGFSKFLYQGVLGSVDESDVGDMFQAHLLSFLFSKDGNKKMSALGDL